MGQKRMSGVWKESCTSGGGGGGAAGDDDFLTFQCCVSVRLQQEI